jgi:hypothetical protein
MDDNGPAGIAWDRPRTSPRSYQRWPIVDLIAGTVLVLARLIAPGVPGLLFKDSISQVQGICASNLGVLAQTADSSVAHGCANASTAMTVLNVAAALGVLLLVVGGANLLLKAIRQAQQDAAGPYHGR